MFYISKAALKNLAKDTRRFSFVGSGVNAVTNIVGWNVMHHQDNAIAMAGLAVLWFIVFQVVALIIDSLAEDNKNRYSALRPRQKKRSHNASKRKL